MTIMFQRSAISCTVVIVFCNVFICTCFAVRVTVDNIDVVEGSETRITCRFVISSPSSVSSPIVTWNKITNCVTDAIASYQDGTGSVSRSYSDRFSVEGDATLVIVNTTRSDSGTYQCKVTIVDDLPTDSSDDAILTVMYLDNPILSSFATPVTEGDTVVMTCSADAFPSPTYTFLKDGEIQQSVGVSTLAFPSSSLNNAGTYQCRANNSAGTKTSESRMLDVQFKPKFELPGNATVSPDELYVIAAVVSANPGYLTYQWTTEPPGIEDADTNPAIFTVNVADVNVTMFTITVNVTNIIGSTIKMMEITVVSLRAGEPCKNGGTCSFVEEVYNCKCTNHFNGLNCTNCIYKDGCDLDKGDTYYSDWNGVCGCCCGDCRRFDKNTNRCEICSICSNSTSLSIGMFVVGIIVGAFGVTGGLIGYTKIKQKKNMEQKKQEIYMDFTADRQTAGNENQTYQDLQYTYREEETAYANVKPEKR